MISRRFLRFVAACVGLWLATSVARAQFSASSFVSTPNTSATNPVVLNVGQAYLSALSFTITFNQLGTTIATIESRGIIPPGLSTGGLQVGDTNTVSNRPTVVFFGTPTTAGDYHLVVNAIASTGTNSLSQGQSWDVYFRVVASGTPPTITTQPVSQAGATGGSVTFSVVATGDAPLSYQWRKDGTAISGSTNSTLTLTNLAVANAGSYTVVVSNAAGSVTSNAATLTVSASNAPVITRQPTSLTVNSGGTIVLNAAATGTPSPTYQWRKDGVAIAGATSDLLVLAAVSAANAGSYTLVATNSAGSATSNAAVLTLTTGQVSRISNLSVRTSLGSGQTLTVGFVTSGPKTLLLRAVGPTLGTLFNLAGFFADPKLTVRQGSATIDANDNWDASLSATFASVGAFPLDAGSKDAALTRSINGPTTADINGTGSGVTLVEVYDAQAASPSRLTNVSARNQVGTGANILISGFVVEGGAARTLLIRGIGPALFDVFGVGGVLADPVLEIHTTVNNQDTIVASNDNWNAALSPHFASVGAYAFNANSKDAALLVTLAPGVYTAQVAGANSGTGDGVVEVYEVP
jgi:hypothetical protein